MIAINWFEIFLPSADIEVQVETFAGAQKLPERIRGPAHLTVIRRGRDSVRRYHVTASHLPDTARELVNVSEDPNLVKHVLEQGFAERLREMSFAVRRKHVGGLGVIQVAGSLYPDIYSLLEGVRFRGFFVGGRAEPIRWGMVLSSVAGQRLCLSLADHRLRQLAMGRYVVPMADAGEGHSDPATDQLRGRVTIIQVDDESALVQDDRGCRARVPLDEWTLPCNKWVLTSLIGKLLGSEAASAVAQSIDEHSLVVTSGRRINTALARDQYERLQSLLRRHQLLGFRLPLPGQPSVRMSEEPLVVEA